MHKMQAYNDEDIEDEAYQECDRYLIYLKNKSYVHNISVDEIESIFNKLYTESFISM
jgi:hypothetical protein